jgi:methionyl aminopeptidase
MSFIKNSQEIAHIRISCRMASEILQEIIEAAVPGATTTELDRLAEKLTKERGAVPSFKGYLNYPCSSCISINDEVVHGLPSERVIQEGDIIGIDFGVNYRGYFSDVARTIAVGSVPAPAKKLIEVTKISLDKGIAQVKPGNHVGDIGHAVQSHVEKNGFSIVRDLVGHGVGTDVHEPPAIPNYGAAGKGETLVAGMVIAIEPMVNAGGAAVLLQDDGWTFTTKDGSLSAHFEDTILVTERGHEVLTRI